MRLLALGRTLRILVDELQRDPLGYVDGLGLYEYAMADPVGFVDPAGLRIDKVVVYLPRYGFLPRLPACLRLAVELSGRRCNQEIQMTTMR